MNGRPGNDRRPRQRAIATLRSAAFALLLGIGFAVHAQVPVPTVLTQIVAAPRHSCGLATNGAIWCWGRNTEGQLGDGTNTDRDVPTNPVSGISNAVAIATHGEEPVIPDPHPDLTCALTDTGSVKCWGSNSYGQVGIGSVGGTYNTPQDVCGLSNVAAIAVGSRHACALTTDGAVRCWGNNDKGQLGDGTRIDKSSPPLTPAIASGAIAIAAGYRHSCAILATGDLQCWGWNDAGQVGNGAFGGDPGSGGVHVPTTVSGLGGAVTAITVGGLHTCAIVGGGAKCWGENTRDQLGNGPALPNSATPVNVFGLTSGVAKISGGGRFTCAVTTAGAAKCWGENNFAQAGNGLTTTQRDLTVDDIAGTVFGLASGMLDISATFNATCALTIDGSMRCWGANFYGRIGIGPVSIGSPVSVPVTPIGLRSGIASSLAAAGGKHSCARTTAGGVMCWGRNVEGQLGNGATLPGPADVKVPVAVSGLSSGIDAVATGGSHTCALTSGGGVKCWGANTNGQLGNNSTTSTSTPVDVHTSSGDSNPLAGVLAIATGENHSCALMTGGTVKCWGSSSRGQLGNNVTGGQQSTPVEVHTSSGDPTPLPSVSAIAAGEFHNCAIVGAGAVCWGYNNFGQLGSGTDTPNIISTPVAVAGLGGTVFAITGGAEHTCAKVGTNAQCWGRGTSGQLGGNVFADSLVPITVRDAPTTAVTTDVAAIEAGSNHTCVTITVGGPPISFLKCWGLNDHGQLGNYTLTNSALAFVPPFGFAAGVTSISAGREHTCAIEGSSGQPRCWGANDAGQLGDSTTVERTSPADVLLGSQSLSFASPAALQYLTATSLSATALSGLAASFDSWTASTCGVSGATVTPTELGLCGLRAKQSGDASFRPAPQQLRLFVVGKSDQNIVIVPITDKLVSAPPVTLSTSQQGGSGNAVVFSTPSSASICTVAGTTATIVGLGTCTIHADQAGNAHYNAGHAETTFQIQSGDQVITFGAAPTPTYTPGGTFTVSATSASPNSGNPIVFTVPTTTTICEINPPGTSTVNILAAGLCTVEANQAGNANYNAAPAVTQDITIAKHGQTVTFDAAPTPTYSPGGQFSVSATSASPNSGNAIVFTVPTTTTICEINPPGTSTVNILAAGLCTVEANQAGNGNYNAAPAVTQNITIAQASQTITGFTALGAKTFGDAPFNAIQGMTINGGGSGNPVQFFSTTGGTCSTTTAGIVTLLATGSCTIEARQAGNANYTAAPNVPQSFTINLGSQTITGFVNPGTKTFGDASFDVSIGVTGGGSGNPVQFTRTSAAGVCNVTTAGVVSIVGVGSCTIEANQAASSNYNAAPAVPQTFAVGKASQTITGFATITDKLRTDPPFGISASATSGLTVAFTTSSSACSVTGTTVTILDTGSCSIDADQAGDDNYNAAPTVNRTFTVNAAAPTQPVITFAIPGNQRATFIFTVALDGGSPITGYNATCTPSGSGSGPAGAPTPIAVTGLTNGTTYTCSVTATNAAGTSLASATVNVVPSAGPFAYPVDAVANAVRIVEVASDSVLGSFPVGSGPRAVVAAPNGQRGYVANFTSGTVSVFDVSTHLVTHTLTVGAGPTALAISPDGSHVYSSNRNGDSVSVIETTGHTVVGSPIAVGTSPAGIAVSRDGTKVFVANSGSNSISVISTATNLVTATISPVPSPQGIAANPSSDRIYVVTGAGTMLVIDTGTHATVATIVLASASETVAVKHDGARAYAGHNAGSALSVINTGSNTVVTSVPMGGNVSGVSVGTDNAEVYVTLSNTGQVKLVDTTTNGITVTIPGLGTPSGASSGFVTPIKPTAPIGVSATSGNGQASVAFTTPPITGGSMIVSYEATCTVGPFSASGSQSPIIVTGLTNGTLYNCSVTATNAVGTGPASASASVTPATTPAFTSANSVTFTVNTAATPFTVTATGVPAPTLSRTGSLPSGVTFVDATGVLSGTAALGTVGNYPITFHATNPSGTTNQSFTLTIAKSGQTINFGTFTPINFGAAAPALTATATSGLTVSYAVSPPAVCSVSGSTLTILSAGTCAIVASQAGDANYNAAPDESRDLVINAVAPDAPTIGTATGGNGQATISFTPPAFTGGVAITGYTATCTPGPVGQSGATSPITVTGLTNGTLYTCSVIATNSAGPSAASGNVTVTPSSPPAFTSANAVTFTVNTAATPFTVTASGVPAPTFSHTGGTLPSGVTFTPGTAQLAGTPALGTVGNHPITFTATNLGGSVNQSFTLTVAKSGQTINFGTFTPINFGAAAPALTATATSGLTVSYAVSPPAVCSVSGSTLTILSAGTCAIVASQAGDANYNAAPDESRDLVINAVAPGAPTIGTATGGNGQATISFTPPAFTGGVAITGYTATCTPGPVGQSGATSPITVTGLTNGTLYTCSVIATNSAGPSAASGNVTVTPSSPPAFTSANAVTFTVNTAATPFTVTASGVPAPTFSHTGGTLPSGVTFTPGTAQLAGTPALGTVGNHPITFTATNLGGSVNQSFTLTVAKSGQTINFGTFTPINFGAAAPALTATATSGLTVSYAVSPPAVCSVSGSTLTILSAGTCAIVASQAGDANYNAAPDESRNLVINAVAPGAPTIGTATAGNGQATVSFTAPSNTGGAPIISYTASCTPGPVTKTGAASPLVVTGLTNGTLYTCSVAATNSAGTGASSGTVTVTPSSAPVFTSANAVTFTVNTAATPFTVTATGAPAPTFSHTGGTLPSGVTFNPGTAVLSGTPALGTVGNHPITFTATNLSGSVNQSFTLTVAKSGQTINFGTFTAINFGDAAPALTATATSGLTVSYAVSPPAVCSVSGSTLTILSAGTCAIVASQAGDANYNAAPDVSRNLVINAVGPGAPTIGTATPGNAQATIAFTPPGATGGAPITSYTVTCNPGVHQNTGPGSPITVTGLTNGVTYTCSVTATNSAGVTGTASGTVSVTPVVPQLSANPASVDFGLQSMGTSFLIPVTISNTGTSAFTITSVTHSGASFAQANNCGALAPSTSCTINVVFSAAIAAGALNSAVPASGSLTITSSAPGSPHVIPLAGSAEKSLVAHYYRSILRRAPDAGGKAFWASEAQRMSDIGANVNEAWFAMAQFFYFSAEYLSFNRTDAEFVTDLYTTFFNRVPDAGGLAFWSSNLQQGMPREVILASFMFSNEFRTFAQAIFGNTTARAEVDVVMDFYRGLLARLPDPGGFTAWVNNFRTAQCAPSPGAAVNAMIEAISSGFAGSGEYAGRNRTNAQYVGDLYNGFLRRGGDLGGVQFWINDINTTARTRENVRQNFIASAEFQARVAAIVAQGCLPP